MERTVDVAILGAGTAGLYAWPFVRRAKKSFVIIDPGPLGTTCARVGCMPSKVAIQVAEDFHRRGAFGVEGIRGGEALRMDPNAGFARVREVRDRLVGRLTNKSKLHENPEYIQARARFLEPNLIEAGDEKIRAAKVIVAVGSRPIIPHAWEAFEDRLLTTDTLFEQEELPRSIAVLGLGVIGLEMGQALARMGVDVTGFDQLGTVSGLQDPAVSQMAVELIGQEFKLHLGQAAQLSRQDDRLRVSAGDHSVVVEKVLAAVGRVSNVDGLGLAQIGVSVDARGLPIFDPETMQVGDLPIFLAGDVTGDRLILHEAADEGRIAGYNAVGNEVQRFRRKPSLGITFTDPNIVSVGAPLEQLEEGSFVVGEASLKASGRALVMGKNVGVIRVYARKGDGLLLGASMIAPRGEHLGHLLAWAIFDGKTVYDLLKMPYYHPVIEESLQNALYALASKLGRPEGLMELDFADD